MSDKNVYMSISKQIRSVADPKYAQKVQRYFKVAKGEYGYGDQFLGIRMPVLRKIAIEHVETSLTQTKKLITSRFHEERMAGLLILVNKYKKTKEETTQEVLYQTYISNFKYINNWDLVDVTCPHIVGKHLMDKDRTILYTWAKSPDLWTKRIAMVSNWWFIRKGDVREVFKLAAILLNDEHDLIHKAVGWMLREAGKKDLVKMEIFLKQHYQNMPRTMLRYAIEKFSEDKRKKYLTNKV